VSARAAVLGFQCTGQSDDGVLVGALQQLALATLELDQLPKILRAELELLVFGLRFGRASAKQCEFHAG